MSNTPPATSHNVLVEGFDDERFDDGTFPNRNSSGELRSEFPDARPSSYGYWVEALAIVLLLPATFGLVGALPMMTEKSAFLVSFLFVLLGVAVAVIASDRNGDPGLGRFILAISLAATGIVFSGISIAQGGFDFKYLGNGNCDNQHCILLDTHSTNRGIRT